MIEQLFKVYRASPFRMRNILGRLTPPIRLLLRLHGPLRINNYQMFLDFSDNACFKYLVDRERYEFAIVSRFLGSIRSNPGAYVIDLGANYGFFTLAAASIAKANSVKKIIAVEPDVRPYTALNKSITQNQFGDFVSLHQVIASDCSGEETFFVNARSSADNRSHTITTAPIQVQQQYKVPSTTVDALLEELSVPPGSKFIVKLDIQGNEARALKGMEKSLRAASGFMIFFEHCPYLADLAGVDGEEFLEYLRSLAIDEFYEDSPTGFTSLAGFEELAQRFDELATTINSKYNGSCSFFVLCKGISSNSL